MLRRLAPLLQAPMSSTIVFFNFEHRKNVQQSPFTSRRIKIFILIFRKISM